MKVHLDFAIKGINEPIKKLNLKLKNIARKLINADFGGIFQSRRASGFEMLNSFQASQNTTCRFPAKPFLEIDLMKGLDALSLL
ncbi:hypothetical protein DBR27_24170 [Flavobacterium sp. HMWF030]|nr:hypothetical protein DBR27_24170 [Flavobacterium sp. HMWF030]